MKVVIITAYLNYDWDIRIKYIKEYLEERGHRVFIISSDFDHRNKRYYESNKAVMIHVPGYKNNLSAARIISHIVFSHKAMEQAKMIKPQIIYAITPPNFLFYYLRKMKERYPAVKVIVEAEDLWPEAFPVSNKVKRYIKPFLCIWASIRDRNLKCANAYVFECRLFEEKIAEKTKQLIYKQTIYLTRENTLSNMQGGCIDDHVLEFLYLGSINNLVDIDLIINILLCLNKQRKVRFHIVGKGEKVGKLEKLCEEGAIEYINHGPVYDSKKKEEIITACHFAFNIMKDTTFVGITMKSLEYFHYGIPIINNIPGDTAEIVAKYKCGVNIDNYNYERVVTELLTISNDFYVLMGKASRMVYEDYFSEESFRISFGKLLKRLTWISRK